MNASSDEADLKEIVREISQVNVLCDQNHAVGEHEQALRLAFQADRQASALLPADHDLQLTCALNVAATSLTPDRREQVESSTHRALDVDRRIRAARNVGEHADLERLSPSHRHDLGRITQILQIFAAWADEESDFEQASNIFEQLVFYQSLLCGENHWTVADLRLKRDRRTLYSQLSRDQRSQLDQSRRLNNRAVDSYSHGEFVQALALVKQAWRISRGVIPRHHFLHIDILRNAAKLLSISGKLSQADRRFRECLSLQAEFLTEQHPAYAGTLREYAEVMRGIGDNPAAEEMLKRAVEVTAATIGKETDDYATCLNDLAVHFHYEAKYDDAQRGYRSAIDVYERINSTSPLFVSALNNLGVVLLRKQDYVEAEATLRQALQLSEELGFRGRGYLQTIESLAETYHEMGDRYRAQQKYREVIALLEELNGPDHYSVVGPLASLAQSLQESGDYRGGEELLRRALAIVRRANRQPAGLLARLGDHYFHIRDWDQAESHYLQALSIQREEVGDDHPQTAKLLDKLGLIEERRGNLDQALKLYQQASAIWKERCGELHRDYAMSLNHLGLLLQKQGDLASAETHLRRALGIRKQVVGQDHHDYATSANNLAYCLKEQGNLELAVEFYQEASQAYERTYGGEHPHLSDCLNNLAMTYADLDDWQRAQAYAKRAFDMSDVFLRQTVLISSESQRLTQLDASRASLDSFLSLVLLNPDKTQASANLACDAVLRRKGISAEVLNLQREWVLDGRYPELAVAREEVRSLRKQIAAEATVASGGQQRSRRLQQLHNQLNLLEAELARKIPEEELQQRLGNADLSKIAAALPKDTALIEIAATYIFPMGRDKWEIGEQGKPFFRYLAFVLHSDNPTDAKCIDLGEVVELNLLAAEFLEAVEAEGSVATNSAAARQAQEKFESLGDRLRRSIFDPLKPILGDITKIIISPDGELHRLPFEILPSVDKGFLIDRYRISYVGTGRDIVGFQRPPARASNAPLVIADPDFNLSMATEAPVVVASHRRSRDLPRSGFFDPLPGARIEGNEIARLLGVSPWLSENALEGRLRHSPSPIVLHIATHGFFLPTQSTTQRTAGRDLLPLITADPEFPPEIENPLLRSGLALAGANKFLTGKPLPEEAEDGLLNAEDVGCLDLFDTELVVLSACQTGRGNIQTGEGVFGLRRSFAMAGAKSVVMSLWKVPDRETRCLMVDFYQRLIAGEARSDALRQAQLGLKQQFRPFFWGAFVCVGALEAVAGLDGPLK